MSTTSSVTGTSPRRRPSPGNSSPQGSPQVAVPPEVPVLFTAPDLFSLQGKPPTKGDTAIRQLRAELVAQHTSAGPHENEATSAASGVAEHEPAKEENRLPAPHAANDEQPKKGPPGERERVRVPLRQRRVAAEVAKEPWYRNPARREWLGKLGTAAVVVIVVVALALLFLRPRPAANETNLPDMATPVAPKAKPKLAVKKPAKQEVASEPADRAPVATANLAPAGQKPLDSEKTDLFGVRAPEGGLQMNEPANARSPGPALPADNGFRFPETATPHADMTSGGPTYPVTSPSTYRYPAETASDTSPASTGTRGDGVASLEGTIEPTPIQRR